MADSTLSDGARQAGMLDNENADIEYGMDGAEASMMTLVDGKLVPIGDTHDDVAKDQLMNRFSDDDERGMQGNTAKTYENSEAAQHPEGPEDMRELADNMAEADITQTSGPDRTSASDITKTIGWATDPTTMMVPTTPGAPTPYPTPATPPPTQPGPEIPDFPQPSPGVQEPTQPEQIPPVTARLTFTAMLTTPNPDEGMITSPETSPADRPYEPTTDPTADYESGERVSEADQMETQPREAMDESLSKKEQMDGGNYPIDPADEKSTEGMDRPYTDSQRR